MSKSYAAGGENDVAWKKESPTPAQLKEFFAQIHNGRITRYRLQEFLNQPSALKDYSDVYIKDTKIVPGMRLVWERNSRYILIFPPNMSTAHMCWSTGDNKLIVNGLDDECVFYGLARTIAETHGLSVHESKFGNCRNYLCYEFVEL